MAIRIDAGVMVPIVSSRLCDYATSLTKKMAAVKGRKGRLFPYGELDLDEGFLRDPP
jgi:hypothetical protein